MFNPRRLVKYGLKDLDFSLFPSMVFGGHRLYSSISLLEILHLLLEGAKQITPTYSFEVQTRVNMSITEH
jgi:hypothetical protein